MTLHIMIFLFGFAVGIIVAWSYLLMKTGLLLYEARKLREEAEELLKEIREANDERN